MKQDPTCPHCSNLLSVHPMAFPSMRFGWIRCTWDGSPDESPRAERFAVIAGGYYIGDRDTRTETEQWAKELEAERPTWPTRVIRMLEVREGEQVVSEQLLVDLRHLASARAYADAWPRTAERTEHERDLFRAWDTACLATHLERVDPPYETLRAFLSLLFSRNLPDPDTVGVSSEAKS